MIKLPKEVNKDIDGIKNTEGRLMIRLLTFGVVALGIVCSVLWYELKNKGTKIDTSLEERNRILRIQYLIKDSALIDCLNSKILDAHQDILREQRCNEERRANEKRQDSILALLNKYR